MDSEDYPKHVGWLERLGNFVGVWFAPLLLGLCVLGIAASLVGFVIDQHEMDQREKAQAVALAKYQAVNVSAEHLERMRSVIELYHRRVLEIESHYPGIGQEKWARGDLQDWSAAGDVVSDLSVLYNGAVEDYNGRMQKTAYPFTTQSELPRGADRVLPRSYCRYGGK